MGELCEHKWTFIETKTKTKSDGGYNVQWIRVDRFFCEKCLEPRDVIQQDWSREAPHWW
jgi:hypothetical protein